GVLRVPLLGRLLGGCSTAIASEDHHELAHDVGGPRTVTLPSVPADKAVALQKLEPALDLGVAGSEQPVVLGISVGIEGTLQRPRRPDIGLNEARLDWIRKRGPQRSRARGARRRGRDGCQGQGSDCQGVPNANDHAIPAGMCLSTSLGWVMTPVTALAAATAGLDR